MILTASLLAVPSAGLAFGHRSGAVGGLSVAPTAPFLHAPRSTSLHSSGLSAAILSLANGAGPARGFPIPCQTESATEATCGSPNSVLRTPASPDSATLPGRAFGHPLPAGETPAVTIPSLQWVNVTGTISSSGAPSVFFAHMAFDPGRGAVVLFGGCTLYACPDNQLWEYRAFAWQNLTGVFSSLPSPRYGFGMDYSPSLMGVVVFGGIGPTTLLSDTWLYTGAWTNISLGVGTPGANGFTSMAWDPALNGLLLVDGCANAGCTSMWSGTWLLDQSGWSTLGLGPGGVVQGFDAASMAYDLSDGYMLFFGGYNGTSVTNVTFTYAAGTWTDITSHDAGCFFVCFTPPARDAAVMTWDGQGQTIFLTGGYNSSTFSAYNDSWIFGRGTWFPADFLVGPTAPAAYDNAYAQALAPNSSTIAPFIVGGLCATVQCFGNDWVREVPPAFSNVTATPNPADANGPVTVTGQSIAGYGSGPIQVLEVGWGNFWYYFHYSAVPNFTSNWSGSISYAYGTNSPPGTYAASAWPLDYFAVPGPQWNFTIIVNVNLTGTLLATPTTLEAGASSAFSITPSQGTPPYSYNWSFGDGSNGTGASIVHRYATAGTFLVNSTVYDAGRGELTQNQTITVLPALVGSSAGTPTAADAGVAISFLGSASGGSGSYVGYAWSFGDGTTSTVAAPSHSFATAGSYHVVFNVTDSLGYVAFHNLTFTVNPALSAAPTGSASTITAGGTVNFTAGASSGTAPYSYHWLFGDGGSSSLAAPSHAFASTGTFTVNLWVNDSGGGSVTKTLTVTVNAAPPPGSGSASTPSNLVWWLLAVGVIIVVAAAIAVLLLRRRRRPPVAPPTPPSGTGPAEPAPPSSGPPPGAMG